MAWDVEDLTRTRPELGSLTDEEKRRWLGALASTQAAGWIAARAGTALALLVLFGIFLSGFLVLGFSVWMLFAPRNYGPFRGFGNAMIVLVIAATIGLSLFFAFGVSSHARRLDRRRRVHEQITRRPPACARCRYELSGAAGLPGRPGVVRCSECALVNPVPVGVVMLRHRSALEEPEAAS